MSDTVVIQNKAIEVRRLGVVPYAPTWDLQKQLLQRTVDIKLANRAAHQAGLLPQPTPNVLLVCQHPHVYTLGKSGKPEHLLKTADELATLGVEFFPIERGGDITYHGPGQLVGYPILDLENFSTDLNLYLRNLEEAVILTLADYGLVAARIPGLTGVWLGVGTTSPRKICAIGIKCSRWVTMHGFAFNINTDLRYFGYIVPCGITDKGVTSLAAELGAPQDFDAVTDRLLHHLSAVFGWQQGVG